MRLLKKALTSALTGTAALLLVAGVASAQTTGGPGTGTGTNPAPGGGSGAPTPTSDLDLPIGQPPAPQITPTPEPPEEPDEPEDPRDEPPPTLYGEELESENDTIFYVIDISCSMDWDSASYTTLDGQTARGTRMTRAKVECQRSIMNLGRNFSFNIIAYDCSFRQWSRSMMEANDANKASALGWINGLRATGATGTGGAVALALGDKDNKMVVLLTDGAPNCSPDGYPSDQSHRRAIRAANTQGATVNVFGIAASGSYRAFCQGVASDNNGTYIDVP